MHCLHIKCACAIALLTVTFLCAACASRQGGDLPPPRLPLQPQRTLGAIDPVFKPGDSLELWVEEDEAFNGTFEVREGGYVLVPKIGRVFVSGLNRDAAEKRVRETLQKQQLKQATVFVELLPGTKGYGPLSAPGSPRISVFLTGAVARPGQHAVPLGPDGRTPGVYETLLIAGGFAKFGDESKVRIMRLAGGGRRQPLDVDVRQIRTGAAADVPIGDGDIIEVPEKVFGF